MRKSHFAMLSGTLMVLGLAACETEEPEVEVAPVAEVEPVAPVSEPIAPAQAVGAVLTVAETPEYEAFIADEDGRALYLLEADSPGNSTCYGECAGVWPPLLAPEGTPTAGDPAVQAGLIGTLERRDGATQVTYGGWPLYYYSGDQGTAQAAGQDLTDEWGEWYLVTPSGEPLEEEGGSGS
jgi:predicted lipoprotein with Yx(FWY)xxD motif